MPARCLMIGGAALVAVALLAASCPRRAEPPTPLVILSWDGAGDAMVDRLLAQRRLPHLARLAAGGVAAEHSASSVPSKTAVAFASLWTGCWPDCHGVTGNAVIPRPAAEHTLLEWRRGFSAEALRAEPLYVTAAKAGRKVVVLSATQSYPEQPHVDSLRRAGVPPARYLSFSGFEHRIAAPKMIDASSLQPAGGAWADVERIGEAREMEFQVSQSSFAGLIFDDPDDPAGGFDTLLVRQLGTPAQAILKPRAAAAEPAGWSPPFEVRRGNLEGSTFFRLFALAADGSSLALYQRQASALRGAHTPAQRDAYVAAYPGFHDDGDSLYRAGRLGTPLMLGGDGSAEERYLELAAFDVRQLTQGTRFALESWRPDVLFHYSPAADDAGHLWAGVLDPHSPAYEPGLAAKIWPFYARVYEQLDAWLGSVMELAPGAVIALVSDHGMAGVTRFLYLNRVLEEAGLAARDAAGEIDLARTRVLAAESPFFLRVNDQAWKEGIVDPADRDKVLQAAAEALLGVKDPETGRQVIPRVLWPKDFPQHGIGGPLSGDLYFDVAPGYYPRNGASEVLFAPTSRPWGEGEHGYWPERRDMHAIFYAMGPGLRHGAVVPPIRHIDVAPTLAHLVGMPAPPSSRGRVVSAMLATP